MLDYQAESDKTSLLDASVVGISVTGKSSLEEFISHPQSTDGYLIEFLISLSLIVFQSLLITLGSLFYQNDIHRYIG